MHWPGKYSRKTAWSRPAAKYSRISVKGSQNRVAKDSFEAPCSGGLQINDETRRRKFQSPQVQSTPGYGNTTFQLRPVPPSTKPDIERIYNLPSPVVQRFGTRQRPVIRTARQLQIAAASNQRFCGSATSCMLIPLPEGSTVSSACKSAFVTWSAWSKLPIASKSEPSPLSTSTRPNKLEFVDLTGRFYAKNIRGVSGLLRQKDSRHIQRVPSKVRVKEN
jgi:hypothetical protein